MAADLRELFLDVTGTDSTTEHQEEATDRDPIADEEEAALLEEVAERATEDGLDEAVDGAESGDAQH